MFIAFTGLQLSLCEDDIILQMLDLALGLCLLKSVLLLHKWHRAETVWITGQGILESEIFEPRLAVQVVG